MDNIIFRNIVSVFTMVTLTEEKMVNVAIMGHGVVGSGVAEILTTHKQKLFSSIGEEIYIKKILSFLIMTLQKSAELSRLQRISSEKI